MNISDEEKRQIMTELAQGNPEMRDREPSYYVLVDKRELDEKDYQKFDDFEKPSSENVPQLELATNNSLKEQITTEIKQAKEAGQLRTERIREIVSAAVFQVAAEFKEGSNDLRSIVRDAVSAVVENLQDKGSEIKEEVTASIEGAIEGISSKRHELISTTQEEVKKLQAKLDSEEAQLQQDVDLLLVEAEDMGRNTSPNVKASIESAINAIKNSEEVALMQKRYAQLQAQAAIVKANLTARYGGRHDEVNKHLEEAKTWYNKTRTQAEPVVEQVAQKRIQLEEKFGNAGSAVARREQKIRRVLSDLLYAAADLLKEKEPPVR